MKKTLAVAGIALSMNAKAVTGRELLYSKINQC